MITRYVNMGSTPGGNGTTDATAGASRAYASLSEAIAAFHGTDPGDAVTIIVRRGAGGKDTTGIFQPNVVTSATRIFRIDAHADDRATPLWDDAKYILEVTNGHGFYNNTINYLELVGLQVHVIETDTGSWEGVKLTNQNQHATDVLNVIDRCYVRNTRTTGNTTGIDLGGADVATRIGIARNCVVQGFSTGVVGACGVNSRAVNVSAVRNRYNYIGDFAGLRLQNCLSAQPIDLGFALAAVTGSSHNAADDGSTAPGANSHNSQTFAFVDPDGPDWHLLEADAGARGLGLADPLNGEDGAFTHDMDGVERTEPWDIGADQYIAAASGTPTSYYDRMRRVA